MANYPTPHIKAVPGDFGQTVLMPGDPLRSQFIAENFLENPILVNNVRGVQGYTGTYKGTRVSVMASGMGMPSIGIYSWELFTVFGVENIMRIGSTGALQPQVNIRDIVVGQGACTDSAWATQYHLPGTFAPIADYTMLRTCVETAEQLGLSTTLATFFPPTASTATTAICPTAGKPTTPGRRWAFLRSRWRLRPSI